MCEGIANPVIVIGPDIEAKMAALSQNKKLSRKNEQTFPGVEDVAVPDEGEAALRAAVGSGSVNPYENGLKGVPMYVQPQYHIGIIGILEPWSVSKPIEQWVRLPMLGLFAHFRCNSAAADHLWLSLSRLARVVDDRTKVSMSNWDSHCVHVQGIFQPLSDHGAPGVRS